MSSIYVMVGMFFCFFFMVLKFYFLPNIEFHTMSHGIKVNGVDKTTDFNKITGFNKTRTMSDDEATFFGECF